MYACIVQYATHVELFVRDEDRPLLHVALGKLPSSSLLSVPERPAGRVDPPFNPFPKAWSGPSEPPMERG